MDSKPVVRFRAGIITAHEMVGGLRYLMDCEVIDHPNFPVDTRVVTSIILNVKMDRFGKVIMVETLNTIYKAEDESIN